MYTRAGSAAIGLLALGVFALRAQTLAANVARAKGLAARDAGALWGARLDTVPWFFVGQDTVYLSADPGVTGYGRVGALWTGPLPAGVIPANTSLDWAGRRWAMVVLPLPDDTAATSRLLLHEVWHVIQPGVLPIPLFGATGVGTDLLDQPEGRLWLLLEWRALAAALDAPGRSAGEDTALAHALLFRARRYAAAAAEEQTRERLLDLSEGLAEYSGWKLTGNDAHGLAATLREEAPRRRSYVRAFPYYTGPAYAMLLDRRRPGWIARLRDTLDLQALIARTLAPANATALVDAAERAGRRYGLDSLRAAETTRWVAQQRRLDSLRTLFVEGPTLRLRPKTTQIAFDPGRQYSLGALGSVMGGFQWKDAGNAELTAPEGALVGGDWQEIRVPLDTVSFTEGVLTRLQTWTAGRWTLTLPAGWTLTRAGASWIATPPR